MTALLEKIEARAKGLAEELVTLRREFHQHPETSHQEERTGEMVVAYFMDLGLTGETGIAGHGVVGVLKGGQPGRGHVAWRADMDALPIAEATSPGAHSWRAS